MRCVLIAEDLLLLVTDDASGKLSAPAEQVDAGLGGSVLVELVLMNRVDLSRDGDQGKPGRIIVRDSSPTGDGILDAALGIVSTRQGKKPSTVIKPLSQKLRQTLYERLAMSGVIRAEEGRILGIFPTHHWPAKDARHEIELHRQVTQMLVQQTTPNMRSVVLIAVLHALGCEHKIVDCRQYELSRRQLRARAQQIAGGNCPSAAVRKAIDDTMAAVRAAAAVPVVSG